MNKTNVELKKSCQIYLASEKHSSTAKFDHILTGDMFNAHTLVRCGQLIATALIAGGVYLLNLWSGDGVRLLAALAATSSLIYIGLAIQSRSGVLALINLLAVPILFTSAYAGMSISTGWLIVSFLLHGCVTAVQFSTVVNDLRGGLFFWSVFNGAMALFLWLN
jgi:hypothetical protein